MAQRQKLRYELKYLLRREQLAPLLAELGDWMQLDANAGSDGVYPVASLYYDTPDYKAYWDKIDGHRNRRKVRVRAYGPTAVADDTPVHLEVKQRINRRVRKERVALPYAQAVDFDGFADLNRGWERGQEESPGKESPGEALTGEENPAGNSPTQATPPEAETSGDGSQTSQTDVAVSGAALLDEVYYLYRTLQLRPTCIVTYNRMAFEGRESYADLRVTVDTNLRGRTHDLSLVSTGAASNRTALGPEFAVLEVKCNHSVPGWVAQFLARYRCTFYRISKYCLVLEKNKAIAARQHIAYARPTA